MLNIQYDDKKHVVEIHCDKEGLEFLIERLIKLSIQDAPEHDHLMTPSWAGQELTEEKLNAETELINHLVFYLVPEGIAQRISGTDFNKD